MGVTAMMRRPSLIALALAGILAGAASAASDPRDGVFEAHRDGTTLIHKASGMPFPDDLAGFRRTGEAVFGVGGEYVGVRYVRPLRRGAQVELRIAVVHILNMTPREHYVIWKPMALRGVSNVRQVAEGPYSRPDAGAPGYRGLFQGSVGGRPMAIGLWAFDRGYWDLRVRASFPLGQRREAEQAIGIFVSQFRGLDQNYEAP